MQKAEVRLELLKILVPQATRVGISEPKYMIESCRSLEQYVLDCNEDEKLSDSSPKRKPGRPKRTTEDEVPGFLDPTHGG